jgi:hypothetical protein
MGSSTLNSQQQQAFADLGSEIRQLRIDQQVHVLEAGDSFSFKSHRQHRYANPSTTDETMVIWANTPITLRK